MGDDTCSVHEHLGAAPDFSSPQPRSTTASLTCAPPAVAGSVVARCWCATFTAYRLWVGQIMNSDIQWPLLVCAGIAACLLAHSPLRAEDFEQHDAHEHGSITINIALESRKLTLELRAPEINVVGFEHSPRTALEKSAAADALAMLKSASGFIGVPPEARCRLTASQVTSPRWAADDHQHEHSEYSARLSYVCDVPQKLEWLEPWVLGRLRDVHEARVSVISPEGQHSQNVRGPKERVPLRSDRR
jgi:hypothetical protein